MREPLLLPAAALAAGIVISRFVSFGLEELCVYGGAMVTLALVARGRSKGLALACVLFTMLFGGILLDILHRPGPPPQLDAGSGEIVILTGCVVEPPVFFEDRQQFILELAPGARARVNLYLREAESPPRLRYGQRVELEARVRHPHNFGNPGSFDYAGYLARQQIYWTAYARAGAPVRVLDGDCGNAARRAVFGIRQRAIERLDELYRGNPYATAMMQAVLVGEKSRLEKVWTEDFRRTGTYHALVISGLHLAVLAGVVLFLLRLCSLGEGPVFLIGSASSWLYAAVTGWHAPVIRAAAGLTLYLAARFFFRRRRLLNLISAVAAVFLILDPQQLFEASFQLSFLAVIAIAALAVPLIEKTSAPFARGLAGIEERDRDLHLPPRVAQFRVELRLLAETVFLYTRLPERWGLRGLAFSLRPVFYFYELFAVSAAVQVGMMLPMAVYFHRVSLSGLSANLAVVPLMSILVPVGFLAVFTGWRAPAAVAGWLLGVSQKVVEWHAQREPLWRIPDPPLWLAICFCASLILLGVTVRGSRWWRRGAIAAVSALLAVLLWHPFAAKVERGALEFTAIDVGQGDSLFIALPDSKLMLLDGGGIAGYGGRRQTRLDIGEDVVSPYLWGRSIRRLDVVVMSHAHEDHMGGLASIVKNFRPRELWTGPAPETPAWSELREIARGNRVSVRRLAGGERFEYGKAQFEVLSPPGGYPAPEEARDQDSLVIRLSYGKRSILTTGDVDRRTELKLIEANALRRTDILKVAHHGSKTSSSEPFLEVVRPTFAVISVGYENPYGHPHPGVVKRLEEVRGTILRTDLSGFVSVVTDGARRFELSTGQWAGAQPRLFSAF